MWFNQDGEKFQQLQNKHSVECDYCLSFSIIVCNLLLIRFIINMITHSFINISTVLL